MTNKIKCALIGPGNIGTDLLAKLKRSPVLEPVWMVGIDPESDGLKRAREMGIKTVVVHSEADADAKRADGPEPIDSAHQTRLNADARPKKAANSPPAIKREMKSATASPPPHIEQGRTGHRNGIRVRDGKQPPDIRTA